MDLKLELLEDIEAPLSDQFWDGFLGAAGIIVPLAIGGGIFLVAT